MKIHQSYHCPHICLVRQENALKLPEISLRYHYGAASEICFVYLCVLCDYFYNAEMTCQFLRRTIRDIPKIGGHVTPVSPTPVVVPLLLTKYTSITVQLRMLTNAQCTWVA